MKKIWALLMVMFLAACSKPTFKGYEYVLSPTADNMAITLAFSEKDNRFYGKAVNNYFGTYEATGNQIKLNQVGATMMMGAPEEMAAERNYLTQLSEVRTYRIADNYLTLILENGKELLFEKKGKATDTPAE